MTATLTREVRKALTGSKPKSKNHDRSKAIARIAWLITWWILKRGWRHRVNLAPIYAVTLAYILAVTEYLLEGAGSVSVAAGTVAGLAIYRWRGLPIPAKLTGAEPREQGITIGAWTALGVTTALAVITANFGTRLPIPGIWLILAATLATIWITVQVTAPIDSAAITSERAQATWARRVASQRGPIPGSTLGKVSRVDGKSLVPTGHLGPVVARMGWTATVELDAVGASAQSVLNATTTAKIAAAYKTATMNVVLNYDDDRSEHRIKVTIMDKTATADVIPYDPDVWQVHKDGCVPIAVCADGTVPQFRVWEPKSGGAHTFGSGTSGSGKSRAAELIITQAVATGHVVPVIADPQRGASLPAWGGQSGVAPVIARNPDDIEILFAALQKVAAARGDFLARLGMSAWDAETMLKQYNLPILLVVLEEAHMVLQGEGHDKMRAFVEEAAKIWRKLGMSLFLITQTPNLDQVGGSQAIRDNLTSSNRFSGRTGSRVTGGMILPPTSPDPYAIPMTIGNGKISTKGMCSIATSAPFGDVTTYARFPFMPDDLATSEAIRLTRDVMPDLDPEAAKLLGVDVAAWRKRVVEIADGAAAPETGPSTLVEQEHASIQAQVLAYLQKRGGKPVQRGVMRADLDVKSSTLSQSLARLKAKNLVESPTEGVWRAVAHPTTTKE